jgi:5-methylcytosine-specific restriction endonuclease McrA
MAKTILQQIMAAIRGLGKAKIGERHNAEGQLVCYYCGTPLDDLNQKIQEHIIPISCFGETKPANLVYACLSCNTSKRDNPCSLS